ncbi:MAG: PAS domain S-box protein [Nostoc sp. SerVER01]|nr:PAS domain S-box protein [Nostoc sp. SerVER01]
MQALSQFLGLESLESVIDCSPLMVVPETPLSDAIALMATQSKSIMVGSCSQLAGCFTKRDLVQLIASGTDLKTAKISEVMHTSVKTLKVSEFQGMPCVLSLLCQQQLDILPVVDRQGQVVGAITHESICQALAQEIEKTTDNYKQTEERRRLLESAVVNAAFIQNQHQKIHEYTEIDDDTTAFEVLCESEQCYCMMTDRVPVLICISDSDALGNFFNQSWLKSTGRTLEQKLGSGCTQGVYSKDIQSHIAIIGSFERERLIFFQGQWPKYKWLPRRAILLKDTTGKPGRLIGVSVDITSHVQAKEEQLWQSQQAALQECKLAHEALKHSEEKFRNLVEASSDWIWEIDENTVYTYVSPKIRDILGYEPTEILGKTPFDFMSPEEAERLINIFTPIAAAQQPFKCLKNINIHQDGHLVVLETSAVPVFNAEGQFRGYRGVARDITEHKHSEIPQFRSQQQLQYLLSFSPAVIYTCKTYGDFGATFISENVTTITGYEAQTFVKNSKFWASHIHPEDTTQVFAELSKILEQGQYTIEYRFLHQDGIYRWIYDQGKLVRDRAGKPMEIVGYWVDITERKLLEQELRVALEKEKQLSELKSRFVSMTSHEFRTPLTTILSSCELLEHYRHKWTQEKQLTHFHRIQSAVKRMTEMLNDVLVIGKAGTGKLEYRPTSFDLVQYCQQLVEEIQMNLNNQRLISFTSQHESIPCCMDERLLGHIFNNLLSNAIKYSPDDSIVKFSLRCQNGQAVFEIQDWGIGIPEKDLPFLFESFHRANNVGNILGTGLGMAIVKKCIDIHRGKIFVRSTEGLGTKFTVIISLNNKL